ncbi:MAG: DUF2254 domain-containing protein, partial [Thermoproteota archaeon]|nr:DUF2254 domain-containing protein [Thermoproteota archaeon]
MIVPVENIYLLFSKINSKIIGFRQSILFYPVIFTLVALMVFIVTSSIDESITAGKLSVDIPYVESLVFTGSANAARSILSTIASGWTTILGVAYSVT